MLRTMKQSELNRLMARRGGLNEKERKLTLGLILKAKATNDDCWACRIGRSHTVGKTIADTGCLDHTIKAFLN